MAGLRFTAADPAASTLAFTGTDANYALLDGSDFGSVTWDHKFSGPRGTQGARPAQGVPQNRKVRTLIRVAGSTATERNQKVEALLLIWDKMRRFGGQVRWQDPSETYARIYDVMAVVVGDQSAIKRWQTRLMALVVADFEVAPYPKGDPCDILEDFSLDTVNGGYSADYTADNGALTDVAVTGGVLTSAANHSTEKRLIHTVRGYQWLRGYGKLKFIPGATIASFKAGLIPKRTASNNYLEVYVDDDGANSRLRIDQVVAGSRTNLASTNLAARLVTGTHYWVSFWWTVYGTLVAQFWLPSAGPATLTGTPTTTNSTSSLPASLNATVTGYPGIVWTPQASGATLDDYEHWPNVLPTGLSFPSGSVPIQETIPGDAPALVDWQVHSDSHDASPIWAMLGWHPRVPNYNRCWNGDFEVDIPPATPRGWSVAAVTGVTGAATSIQANATAARTKYAVNNAQIVTPATANTGASFEIWRTFYAGVTYTAELWASAASATTNTRIRLGTNGDIASETASALSATPTRRSVTWTPATTVNRAWVAFEVTAATGTTMNIDGVMVYEGTTAPTLATQQEGRGGDPPFGVLVAANSEGGQARVTDATNYYEFGFGREVTVAGTVTNSSLAAWILDPALLTPDDYAFGAVEVEVWAQLYIASTVTGANIALYVEPIVPGYGNPGYGSELGSAGKSIVSPLSGTARRFTRLGTVSMFVDRKDPIAWRMVLLTDWAGSGKFGVGYAVCVPIRSRAALPTGKPNASVDLFIVGTGPLEKTVTSDLRLRTAKPGSKPWPGGGSMGGSLLELPPGSTDITQLFTAMIPDDPTSASTSDAVGSTPIFYNRLSITPRWQLVRDS